MTVILQGWVAQIRETHMVYNGGLILNKFRFYNIRHIRWIIPYQFPGRMKNSSYDSAKAGIRTLDHNFG